MDSLEREILGYLADEGRIHVVELADELDEHPVTVDRQCYTLQQSGAIRQTSEGIYSLTHEGRERLETTTA